MDPILIDTAGRPLRQSKTDLARPFATPTLTGIRQVWSGETMASGLTPETLAGYLRAADAGDGRAYLTLAMEMEEREAHYRSVLGTRKRAVTRLPVTVESASDAPADVALADEIRALIRAPGLRGAKTALLDGLGKGFAAVEMCWDTSRTPWVPRDRTDPKTLERVRGYQWIDPRWFRYDRVSGRTLRLLDDSNTLDGVALPAYRYLIHEPDLMSGLPLRSGLARVATIAYMAKSFALGDWLRFAGTYGLPMRLGKYGAGASPDDIAVLVTAVANLGSDWGAVIPESMLVELIQATAAAGGAEVFRVLADWADGALSVLVLGQQASTKGTPGALGNQDTQAEVRQDIRDADAQDLADTLNRDLVGAYLALNHGPMDPEAAPRIVIAEPDAEDLTALVGALKELVPLGLKVSASVVRDRLGLPDPADDDELLGTPAAAPPPGGSGFSRDGSPTVPPPVPALNRAQPPRPSVPDIDPLLLERLTTQGQAAVGGMVDQVRAMLAAAGSLDEALAMVEAAYPQIDAGPLAAAITDAGLVAQLAGRADVIAEGAAQ